MRGASRVKKIAFTAFMVTALMASYQLVKMGTLVFRIYEGVFGTQAEFESIALKNFHDINSSVEFLIIVDNPSFRSLTLNRIEIFLYLNDKFLYRYINYEERPISPLSRRNFNLIVWIDEPQALEQISEAFEDNRWGWSAQCEIVFKTPLGSFLRKLEY